jgi:HEAT repeat protein
MATDIQAIVDRVKNKEYAVQIEAKAAGAAAVPELGKLLQDPDEEVRLLAVHCLVATADPGAATPLGWALFDQDPQTAMAAAKGLHAVATAAQVPALLQAYDRQGESLVKREIALVLGRVAGPAGVPELKKRWENASDVGGREGLTAALARLGDDDARDAFTKALLGSSGPDRLRYLELAEYISQPWLLKPLGEVLDDTTAVLRVAVDARPDLIQALRACDIALVLIAKIGGATFSFAVTRAHNYSAGELAEARAFVKARTP